jgi:hypothetical protein
MDVLIFITGLGCMMALVTVLGNQRKIMEALARLDEKKKPRCTCETGRTPEAIIVAEDDE